MSRFVFATVSVIALVLAGSSIAMARTSPPRIAWARFSEAGHNAPGPHYYVTETIRFRVCSGMTDVTATISERKSVGPIVFATGTFVRGIGPIHGCGNFSVSWRLDDRFVGVGTYRVTLRLRDGGVSRPASHSYSVADP